MRTFAMAACAIAAILVGCDGVEVRDGSPEANSYLVEGQKYYIAGDCDRAAVQFQAAADAAPQSSAAIESCYWLGVCRLNQRRYDEAEVSLRRCINGKPGGTLELRAWAGLGDCQRLTQKYDAAVKSYRYVLSTFDPSIERDVVMLNCGICLMKNGNTADGRQMLQNFIDRYPSSPWTTTAKEAMK